MILAAGLLTAAAAGGCFADAEVGATASYDTEVTGPAPDMAEVSPGVQVVADYDEPVFYADNYYWRNDGGRWYRSNYYNRGWIDASPPSVVAHIEAPMRYRHYRPAGYVSRRHDNRGRTVYRDHRR